ncbi:unnamed protein product [Onchocerca ochengi]|uniref:Pyr_redox_2 domain-containing protein n=1 Tax=Onchocerca ochengi TaxID=42157 RepID=A0A182E0S4_ONCOC|nr:unnamed protein product [Onchocerca ochengi]
MDCGVPFCQGNTGCPLGNIPKWNDYVSKQNWRQALEQLLQANNFPEFTGHNRFSGLAAAAQLNKVGHANKDAILICTGSLIPRDFSTANREAKEICFAMEFLGKSQRIVSDKEDIWEGLNAKGKQVIVLGGGDTATDCTATYERYPDNPWPIIFRTDYGHEERKGITSDDPRLFGFATKKFLVSKSGSGQKILTGLLMIRVDWKKDENGAWRISEIEDSEEEMSCDLCILAMGFLGPEKIDHDLMGKTTLAGPGGVVLAPIQN